MPVNNRWHSLTTGLWLLCTTLTVWGGDSDSTRIISHPNPAYAGKQLELSARSNPFLEKTQWKLKTRCDAAGSFSISLKLENATLIYISGENFLASIYLEPGKSYRVRLPAFRTYTLSERLSPYYSPPEYRLVDLDQKEDINLRLKQFESSYLDCNDQVVGMRRQGISSRADSLIDELKKEFPPGEHAWFEAFKRYRYGMLALNSGERRLEYISLNYLGKEVEEKHPAYMDLFSTMFKDFLVYFNQSKDGKGIRLHINHTQNLDSLRILIARHPALTSAAMSDLLLLQELPRLFYRGDFHKEAILILLDSMEADPARASLGFYARDLRLELASLLPGHAPPYFSLEDLNGKLFSPGDSSGKYIYLMFCTPDNYGCMMEYPFLQSYLPKHSRYLEVVCVMVNESRGSVEAFMKQNDYTFRTLQYNMRGSLLDEYRVKAFPVAFLLGRDGKLIYSPSALPSDKFEQRLFQLMRSRGEI